MRSRSESESHKAKVVKRPVDISEVLIATLRLKPSRRIFDRPPDSWTDLQDRVAQVFSEMGCQADVGVTVVLPRGKVQLDVAVRDTSTAPHSLYVCECKHWRNRIPKSTVHAFRTVVSELGANRGFLISRNGFQDGAKEAAQFTNIDLMSWREFEELMFDRWIEGITRRLNPLFAQAHILMDPNDETLWQMRQCTDKSYEEWSRICARYPLITIWILCNVFSRVGMYGIPSRTLTDGGVLSPSGEKTTLDTYRKVVGAAPEICRLARDELCHFWGLPPDEQKRRMPRSRKIPAHPRSGRIK